MIGLSEDILRIFISEFLIRKLGKTLLSRKSNSFLKKIGLFLKDFDINKSNPRVCFLGYNNTTGNLHWVFINKKYKIGIELEKLRYDFPEFVNKDKIFEGINENGEIELISMLVLLKELIRQKLFIDPTTFLESPKCPQNYTDRIRQNIKIIDGKKIHMLSEIENKDLGLSMLTFRDRKIRFSPFAILDPRSFLPGYWDVIVGIESTLYIPIIARDPTSIQKRTTLGILIISFDYNDIKDEIKKFTQNVEFLENPYQYVKLDKIGDRENSYFIIRKLYKCLEITGDNISNSIYNRINLNKGYEDGIEGLRSLFEISLQNYHDYIFYFDDYVIERNIKLE